MSVINDDYFHLLQTKIAELHDVAMQGVIKPEYYKVQNRTVLIFSLEVILEEHRKKYGHLTNPLKGKSALHHMLLRKYKWPLSEIRSLSLQDSLFLLQEELALESLPEPAQKVIQMFSAHRAKDCFDEVLEDEWDPEFYLEVPAPRSW